MHEARQRGVRHGVATREGQQPVDHRSDHAPGLLPITRAATFEDWRTLRAQRARHLVQEVRLADAARATHEDESSRSCCFRIVVLPEQHRDLGLPTRRFSRRCWSQVPQHVCAHSFGSPLLQGEESRAELRRTAPSPPSPPLRSARARRARGVPLWHTRESVDLRRENRLARRESPASRQGRRGASEDRPETGQSFTGVALRAAFAFLHVDLKTNRAAVVLRHPVAPCS